jgi:hypothetical protein
MAEVLSELFIFFIFSTLPLTPEVSRPFILQVTIAQTLSTSGYQLNDLASIPLKEKSLFIMSKPALSRVEPYVQWI